MPWYAWVLGPPETVVGFLVTWPRFWKWIDANRPSKYWAAQVRPTINLPDSPTRYDSGLATIRVMETQYRHAMARLEDTEHKLQRQVRMLSQEREQVRRTTSSDFYPKSSPGYTCEHCGKVVAFTVNGICQPCRAGRLVKRCTECGKPRDPSLLSTTGKCMYCIRTDLPNRAAMYREVLKMIDSGALHPQQARDMLDKYAYPQRGKYWMEYDSGM